MFAELIGGLIVCVIGAILFHCLYYGCPIRKG